MENWSDKVFYHIYPLGMCGTSKHNDFCSPAGNGLSSLEKHIPRLLLLGVNALYIGPLFESSSHGYDTVDYNYVDRRLGNNNDLKTLVKKFHDNGISVILDAVFNHTGRDFFAFKDIKENKNNSQYIDWYLNIDFSKNNEYNDGFSYEGWAGNTSLVKLNLGSNAVREHLFGAVKYWIEEFDIDGLRLDAANVMSVDFLKELSSFSKNIKKSFWLMGEIVAGDYRSLAHEGCLDSVTNYEYYKSLWSSFNDTNVYEIAWTMKREFANDGLYSDIALYNFTDNHDVNRVASNVKDPAKLFPLYGLLFCSPGIPSIYYGSEYGVYGERSEYSDHDLRPVWNDNWAESDMAKNLFKEICRFSKIRHETDALKHGNYYELLINYDQIFAFLRETKNEKIIVLINASPDKNECEIKNDNIDNSKWVDLLSNDSFIGNNNILKIVLNPLWLRILKRI
ncbi:MAG: alpha-amylase family glycosyl hydrolase [Termitinemataceae bacterium]|nr:MAG: alpha-amylase family glycosyl hydrolase [Termitinemataceae bacterium]